MAQHQIGNIEPTGFINKTRAVAKSAAVTSAMAADMSNYASIDAMRTVLNTANSAYYTNARMDGMTVNDLTYAVRLLNDAGTI